MYVITVTIGRNVGETPMSYARWLGFRCEVAALLRGLGGINPTFEFHDGYGEWHGVTEDSHKATLMLNHALPEEALNTLRRDLSELARLYDQDAIALTIGVSELCM